MRVSHRSFAHKPLTQLLQVYRLLNGLDVPLTAAQIASRLSIPQPSARRCLSELRILRLIEDTPIGVRLTR